MTTKIEWCSVPNGKGGYKTPRTINVQVGCREVSPACRECYAAKLAHRGMSPQHKGVTVLRKNTAGESLGVHWNGEINRVPKMLTEPLRWREPSGVFVGSMTDTFFDVEGDDACGWILALFGIMAACPQHTFMLLTKRPDNASRWFAWLDERIDRIVAAQTARGAIPWSREAARLAAMKTAAQLRATITKKQESRLVHMQPTWPLPNVWIGVTAEDQKRADERIPVLLRLPAAVRFVSYEPACSGVDWSAWLPRNPQRVTDPSTNAYDGAFVEGMEHVAGTWEPRGPWLDWIIGGGESGPSARPAHPDWFRSTRDQCEAAGVPFFFKQWGEWAEVAEHDASWDRIVNADGRSWEAGEEMKFSDIEPRTWAFVRKIGKANAGRLLDGREYNGFPEVAHG